MKTKVLLCINHTGEIVTAIANGGAEVYAKQFNEQHTGTACLVKTAVVTDEQFERMVAAPRVTAAQHNKFPKGRWATAALLLLMLALPCRAMPVLDAIAQAETGGCDTVQGKAGEISRFQMTRATWRQATSLPYSAAINPFTASNVANQALGARIAGFERRHGRKPTVFEQALLWHCPAHVNKPTAADSEYAQRVVNLAAIP